MRVAVCRVAGEDVNARMAAEGWAFAYRGYSIRYVADEVAAKAAERGIWRGDVVAPWDWRRGKRLAGGRTASQAAGSRPAAQRGSGRCTIKGNIGKGGARIYHLPGGRIYGRTRIDTASGERWFCSEAEARAAGWRRSRQQAIPPTMSTFTGETPMKRYYVYENWTARTYSAHDVVVHLHGCAHCPFDSEGRRRCPEPSGANEHWHPLGELESPEAEMRTAHATVPSGIVFRYCGHCSVRCGRMMRVFYGSRSGHAHRYLCRGGMDQSGGGACIGVGGVSVDRAVTVQIMETVSGHAVEAAILAAEQVKACNGDVKRALVHELEQARYEASLANRCYEAVDPDRAVEMRTDGHRERINDTERGGRSGSGG